ncbi:MAG TPA: hypothetical protein VGM95_07445 [Lactobacillaceae bacterium]|jgi:acetyltransferase-like isoleucine patch superfamily enzyme
MIEIVTQANIKTFVSENGNKITGDFTLSPNVKITFHGENNHLVVNGAVNISAGKLTFFGNNSLVYIEDYPIRKLPMDLFISNSAYIYIGENNFFNGIVRLVASEQTNIFIGRDNLFSTDGSLETTDVHLLYDLESGQRINNAADIFIGDHNWFGREFFVGKKAIVGSGSVFARRSLLTGKYYPSHTLWGGSPAKLLKENVSFDSRSGHRFEDTLVGKFDTIHEKTVPTFYLDAHTLNIKPMQEKLAKMTCEQRLLFFQKLTKATNRFYLK